MPYDFTHVWDLRNKTNKQIKGKKREREKERQPKKQTLNYKEKTDGYQREGGWFNR